MHMSGNSGPEFQGADAKNDLRMERERARVRTALSLPEWRRPEASLQPSALHALIFMPPSGITCLSACSATNACARATKQKRWSVARAPAGVGANVEKVAAGSAAKSDMRIPKIVDGRKVPVHGRFGDRHAGTAIGACMPLRSAFPPPPPSLWIGSGARWQPRPAPRLRGSSSRLDTLAPTDSSSWCSSSWSVTTRRQLFVFHTGSPWTRSSYGSAWRPRPEPRPFRRCTTTPNTTASESRLFPPASSLCCACLCTSVTTEACFVLQGACSLDA